MAENFLLVDAEEERIDLYMCRGDARPHEKVTRRKDFLITTWYKHHFGI